MKEEFKVTILNKKTKETVTYHVRAQDIFAKSDLGFDNYGQKIKNEVLTLVLNNPRRPKGNKNG